ncbi:UDP-N-acetylmuramoyl-tripeptide--D-alanyl-D-alanine ligase [Oceanobacillus sp. 1P07AA]|uniref:UDP-N-acetylmuramoyl-tripeptide--D-alanyl-D- alanine ligase n=1 Tax=Oceanobacillus sp. 1P07AA TaxID=3132293 RepID=UPI0039A628A6
MLFTAQWLAELFPKHQGKINTTISIEEVTRDTRQPSSNALYIPIVGERFDGHNFIFDAIKNGAVAALWDKSIDLPDDWDDSFPVFFVDDTITAIQQLAKTYRQHVNPIVIGVTGSNGKTTTKDLVTAVVKTSYKTAATQGNLNNHIGLPLTILSMQPGTEVLVLEMGMSQFGEIKLLSEIAEPDYTAITNIGESHIENLGSRQGIAKAKLEIIEGMKSNGSLFIDNDEPLLAKENILIDQSQITGIGFTKESDIYVSNVKVHPDHTSFEIADVSYQVRLLGKHHAKNAAFATSIGEALNISQEKMQEAFNKLEVTGMRFELKNGKNGVHIINDAYNASATSMKASIQVVKEMEGFQNKVLVLGDILELGTYSEHYHRSVAEVIDSRVSEIYTYGEQAFYIYDEIVNQHPEMNVHYMKQREDVVPLLRKHLNNQTLILFKASRGMKFENFIEELKQ